MSTLTVASAATTSATSTPPFWRRALGHRSFVLGGILTLLLALAATVSLVWTPWSPYEMNLPGKLASPSATHWLGTDAFGRDVASLLLVGARNSILVGVIAVSIGLFFGATFGLIASARRGWVEELIMRLPSNARVILECKDGLRRSGIVTMRPTTQVMRGPGQVEGLNGVVRLEDERNRKVEHYVWLHDIANVHRLDSISGLFES